IAPSLDAAVEALPAAPRISGYAGPRRKILVVDDVVGNRAMLVDMLTPLGFDVQQAGNGAEALQRLHESSADLVLLDTVMAVMDGLETTRRLRESTAWKQLPVIAVSANASNRDRGECLAAGASAFLSKPIDKERSEEHTSELQSRSDLVCRLLLEKKKLHVPCAVNFR